MALTACTGTTFILGRLSRYQRWNQLRPANLSRTHYVVTFESSILHGTRKNLSTCKAYEVISAQSPLKWGRYSTRVFYARIQRAGDKPVSLIKKRAKVKHEEFVIVTSDQFALVTDIAANKSILATASKNRLQI